MTFIKKRVNDPCSLCRAVAKLFTLGYQLDGSEVFIITQAVPLFNDTHNAQYAYAEFGVHNPKVVFCYIYYVHTY